MTIREIPENSTLTLKKKPDEVKQHVVIGEKRKRDIVTKIDSTFLDEEEFTADATPVTEKKFSLKGHKEESKNQPKKRE